MYCFGFRFGGLDKITWRLFPHKNARSMFSPGIIFTAADSIVRALELVLDDLPAMLRSVEDLRVVTSRPGPTPQEQEQYASWGRPNRRSWQHLLQKSQQGLDVLKAGILFDRSHLLAGSKKPAMQATSCFLINLDEMTFEAYVSRYLRTLNGFLCESDTALPFQTRVGGKQFLQPRYSDALMGLVATFPLYSVRSWGDGWKTVAEEALPHAFDVSTSMRGERITVGQIMFGPGGSLRLPPSS